jgi:predicted site-specific integrase-resolvase
MVTGKCFCASCKKDVNFLPIGTAFRLAAISRSTLYNWMEHGWIHWSELPSGHRLICRESLKWALTPVEKRK